MSFELCFYEGTGSFIQRSAAMSEAFAHADLDALRVYEERMVPVAEALEEFLGTPVEPPGLIEVTLDEGDYARIYGLADCLAAEHRLLVCLGDGGVLFNYAGAPDAGIAHSFVRSSIGTVWSQVNFTTIHAAFEDTLRGPAPEVIVASMADVDTEDFGYVSGFHPLPGGGVAVFRQGQDWECETVVDTIARAVDLLQLFADRCPALLDFEWTPVEVARHGVIGPVERLALPLRALGAVADFAPGLLVTLTDNPQQPLTYGRNREGRWQATWENDVFLRLSQTFDSLEELLEVVQSFLDGDVAPYARTWDKSDDAWKMPLWTVTAAELPDRNEMWREASVRAFHERLRLADSEPTMMMRSFVEAANERIGKELIVSEQKLEAAPVVTIMVAQETSPAAFERLIHLAEDRNISLVVNGDLVLLNPSGSADPGRDLCPLSLWDIPIPVGEWKTTGLASLMEVAHRYQPGMLISVESPRSTPPAERSSISSKFEDGAFTVTLMTPATNYRVKGFPMEQAFFALACFPDGVDALLQDVLWEESAPAAETDEDRRFTLGSSCYEPRYYNDRLAGALVEAGLPNVSDWVAVRDSVCGGDYCQIDRISEAEYLVEWGHNSARSSATR